MSVPSQMGQNDGTPRQAGVLGLEGRQSSDRLIMPAEWSPHRATWLAWPHNRSDWPGKLSAVSWCYVDIVRNLSLSERVAILFNNEAAERRAVSQLKRAGVDLNRIELFVCQTDRSWIRDSGGSFVKRRGRGEAGWEVVLVDWRFNAWAKYSNWSHDDKVPERIASARSLHRVLPQEPHRQRTVVFEGGSLDVNGEGTGLATEECLLDESVQPRNVGLGRPGIERVLDDYLGVSALIWLGKGIAGDDTHGHVDDVARFVSPNTVALATEADPHDINHAPLAENWERLQGARTVAGRLTIVPIPMPRPLCFGGQRLPASYLNFYVANKVVLVPTFNDPADRVALGRLAELFPEHKVAGIHALDLVLGLGTVHCLTLQEPLH